MTNVGEFRDEVRAWCEAHVPTDWRTTQTGASDSEFVAFQKAWFAELHAAGFAVPHWPAQWGGGGMPVDRQIVLYSELAAHDAPRLVLAFVGIHHAASTCWWRAPRNSVNVTCRRSWMARSGCRGGSPNRSRIRSGEPSYHGPAGERHLCGERSKDLGQWGIARRLVSATGPDRSRRPKRRGISYFLLDMTSPGIEVRPIRNAVGESHFCEIFLDDVVIPAANLIGAENEGWQVAQATLAPNAG